MTAYVLLASTLLGFILPAAAAPADRPNIVFLFSDDHALQAISAYNYRGLKLNQTPNIDRLAAQGAIFRNNFCANSICSPSRACVLTGKHSHINGVTQWQSFDGSQFTFPKALQAAGYRTAIFGKWHLTSDPTGFDEWMVHPGQGSYYNPDFLSQSGKRKIDGYATDITTDMTLDFIKRRQGAKEPFLVMCHYKAPHRAWDPPLDGTRPLLQQKFPEPSTLFDDYTGRAGPAAKHRMGIGAHLRMPQDLKLPVEKSVEWTRMTPPQQEAFRQRYQKDNDDFATAGLSGKDLVRWKYRRYLSDYLACVDSVDRNVGRILDYLKEAGLERNTIVVYSSDQGFFLGEHGWFDKRWMYEESFRMPLIVRWPATVNPGTEVRELTQNIDFAPTILEAAGLPVPADVQGASLMPLLQGRSVTWRDALYYHYYDGPGEHGVAKHYGIRTDRYKLIRFYAPQDDTWELYDLEKDPQELKSVYQDPAYASVRAEMTRKLEELKKNTGNTVYRVEDEKPFAAPERRKPAKPAR